MISELLPDDLAELEVYIEPFIGGGAVLFHMLENYDFDSVYISDINPELILCYKIVKTNVTELIQKLEKLQQSYIPLNQEKRRTKFEKIRKKWNRGINFDDREEPLDWLINRAAETIFLNRTCFNGIFRVNSKGEFNVPVGSYKNPMILNKENLENVSKALENVHINTHGYDECARYVIPDKSFVYFDPPYRPLPGKPSFTSYVKSGFNDRNQIELAEFFNKLSDDARLMLSNSDTQDNFFEGQYDGHKVNYVWARRNVNSDGTKRGKVSEIIVTNYTTRTQTKLELGKD